jgi:hypothetical protein
VVKRGRGSRRAGAAAAKRKQEGPKGPIIWDDRLLMGNGCRNQHNAAVVKMLEQERETRELKVCEISREEKK